jgi:hypothetical protein
MSEGEEYDRVLTYLGRHVALGSLEERHHLATTVRTLLPCLTKERPPTPLYAQIDLTPHHSTARLRLRAAICDLFKRPYKFVSHSGDMVDYFTDRCLLTTLSCEGEVLILELGGVKGCHYAVHAILAQLAMDCTQVVAGDGAIHKLAREVILVLLV